MYEAFFPHNLKIKDNNSGNQENMDKDDLGDFTNEEELIKKFYEGTPDLKRDILKKLKKNGTRKSIDFLCGFIRNFHEDVLFEADYVRLFEIDTGYAFEKSLDLLNYLDPRKNSINEWAFSQLTFMMADFVGVENMRDRLNEIILEKKKRREDASSYEYAFSYITPCSDKTAITNLQNFYEENIKFEEYEVNKKMNEKEVELLQDLIGKDEKVLEMGCGTGRLLLEMVQAGYDMTGIDFTPRHIELIRQNNNDTKVFQADWHDTKFQGGEFDTVYSLGRNVLHDYSIVDQAATFRESNRLLKKGGRFILDIPNREKGAYGEMVKGYAEEMKKRGIRNFRYGTIYDSPDGEHFATRYAYSHEDIELLCQIAGFEIKEVRRDKLETGSDDENLYYVLEKK